MYETFLAILVAFVFVGAAETMVSARWLTAWEERGFSTRTLTNPRTLFLLFALPVAVAAMASQRYSLIPSLIAAVLMWVATISVITDLECMKIPREPSWLGFGLGAVLTVPYSTSAGLASFATAFLVLSLILLGIAFATKGALGSGDVRLLLAFTPFAAWAGYTPILIGVLIGSLLQAPFRFVLRRLGHTGKGYPFAPALVLGFLIAIVLFGEPENPCTEWLVLSC